jgi:predicted DCC family thiol-disulfide oxidoreductase YuxK
MKDETKVIYNGSCPICSREVDMYRRRTEKAGEAVDYLDLNVAALQAYGLTEDDAARSFHVVKNGQLIEGVDAFRALWKRTPGFRWLAWLVGLPVVRPVARAVYARILAPALYRMHLRRMAQRD